MRIQIEGKKDVAGWTWFRVAIPPRRNGLANDACYRRVERLILETNPDAFDPVPPALAEAMRDAGIKPPDAIEAMPPNCEGNHGHDSYHAHDAPMPPHLAERLDGKDDDEGEPVPGYPPGVSCNVTGECEE